MTSGNRGSVNSHASGKQAPLAALTRIIGLPILRVMLSQPDTTSVAALSSRLATVRARLSEAAISAERDPALITLVAVSKTHDRRAVDAAVAAGLLHFGENRVQEAMDKFADRPTGVRLHIIGRLQTNKARDAVAAADVIEVLDRPALADAIASAADRLGRCPRLLIQVNTGAEPQKGGVALAGAPTFITEMRRRFGDALTGLMCIPPAGVDPVPHFQTLADLARRSGLERLSMGMSGDFEAAIAFGATSIRVGSAIFGTRLREMQATA